MRVVLWLWTALSCGGDQAAQVPTEGEAPVELVFLGDALVGGAMREHTEDVSVAWAFQNLKPLWASAQGVWLNLEGPLVQAPHPEPGSTSAYYTMASKVASGLSAAGISGVLHGNNHALDRGEEGLLETRRNLAKQGVVTLGSGRDLAEAWTPHRVGTPHGEVAVFGMTESALPHAAAEGQPGLARFRRETMVEAVAKARREGAEHVVAFIHWGSDFNAVDKEMRWAAGILSLSGVDLVVGVGPQLVLPVEAVRGTPVVWSLGNSASGAPTQFTSSRPGHGLVVSAILGGQGFEELRARCVVTDLKVLGGAPELCAQDLAVKVLAEHRWDAGEDGVGRFDWPAPWVDPSEREEAHP